MPHIILCLLENQLYFKRPFHGEWTNQPFKCNFLNSWGKGHFTHSERVRMFVLPQTPGYGLLRHRWRLNAQGFSTFFDKGNGKHTVIEELEQLTVKVLKKKVCFRLIPSIQPYPVLIPFQSYPFLVYPFIVIHSKSMFT